MNDELIKKIQEFPTPQTPKQLQRFIGLANYYGRFIKDFAEKRIPLDKAKNAKKQIWTAELNTAWETIKSEFVRGKILAHPDAKKKFYLFTDASKLRAGAVLAQEHTLGSKDGLRREDETNRFLQQKVYTGRNKMEYSRPRTIRYIPSSTPLPPLPIRQTIYDLLGSRSAGLLHFMEATCLPATKNHACTILAKLYIRECFSTRNRQRSSRLYVQRRIGRL